MNNNQVACQWMEKNLLINSFIAMGILLFWRIDSKGIPSAELLPVLTHVLPAFADAKWQTAGDLRATHF